MKVDSISINGKVSEFEVSEKIFSSAVNKELIAQVIHSQISNIKPRLAKTKQRNEIVGSTAKIYAQKGTGNARHASRKAPIFVGGGVAHGPKGNVYRIKKINKKQKRMSLICAISKRFKDKSVIIFDDIKTKINKTKEFNKFLKKNKINNVLIVVDKESKKNIELSTRNIANVKLTDISYLSTFDILKFKKIMFTKTSTKELEKNILHNEKN